MLLKKEEKSKTGVPPVGGYRPKYSFVEKTQNSRVEYGSKSVWERLGKQQNDRIKKA